MLQLSISMMQVARRLCKIVVKFHLVSKQHPCDNGAVAFLDWPLISSSNWKVYSYQWGYGDNCITCNAYYLMVMPSGSIPQKSPFSLFSAPCLAGSSPEHRPDWRVTFQEKLALCFYQVRLHIAPYGELVMSSNGRSPSFQDFFSEEFWDNQRAHASPIINDGQ